MILPAPVAGAGLGDGHAVEALKLVQAHGLGLEGGGVRIVVVADLDLLVLLDDAALDAADGDAAHVLVVVDGAHKHLEGGVKIHLRLGDVLENGIEKGLEIGALHLGRIARGAVAAGAEEHRGIKLLVGGVQVHEKLQDLIHHLVDALVGPVDLVEHHDNAVAKLQGAAQDEAGLGHGALRRVHQQDDAVDHFEDTLHLAAKVGVARGVNDIDLGVAVPDGGVLGHDGDAALALQIPRVHDPVHDLLVVPVDTGLLEHFIDQRGLAVVDMGDNGDVSELIHRTDTPFVITFQHKNRV